MISPLFATIEKHESLCQVAGETAAYRVACGMMKVERDANLIRQFGVTFSHLGKLNPIDATHLQDLIACFSALAMASACDAPCILGLAESGIVPSFAMQQACLLQGRTASWYCTSRDQLSGLRFSEPHSHSPEHFLPMSLVNHHIEELWIVEDEITTGRTLANLLDLVREHCRVERVRVFTILDTRDADTADSPAYSLDEFAQVSSVLRCGADFWTRPIESYSLASQPFIPARDLTQAPGKLAVGETISQLLPGLLSGEISRLHHITLSPWKVNHLNIFSRQQWAPGFYRYNAEKYVGFSL